MPSQKRPSSDNADGDHQPAAKNSRRELDEAEEEPEEGEEEEEENEDDGEGEEEKREPVEAEEEGEVPRLSSPSHA